MKKNMSDKSRTENNRNEDSKEEKLFRAMSGVDEELLLRSEQNGSNNTRKVHKFPMRYVTRIAAACLCFVVAGVMYMTMSSTKMADSTGSAEMAAPQLAYSITADTAMPEANEAARAEQYAAARAEEAGSDGISGEDTAGAAMSEDMADAAVKGAGPESAMTEEVSELPEGAVTESASEMSGGAMPEAASESTGIEGALEAARQDSAMVESAAELPESVMAGADSCCDGGMAESSTEASDNEIQEEEVIEKQGRHLPGKMTRKGQ